MNFKVENVAEGEARRYFDHAVVLKNTILFLRNNRELSFEEENGNMLGVGERLFLLINNFMNLKMILLNKVNFFFREGLCCL